MASGYFLHLHLLQNGVIESNSEPGNEQINKNFSCYCRNVNGLLADNLAKIFQIEAFNSLFNYDFIWISEVLEHQSYDSSVLERGISFQLNGYNLVRADHRRNTKREGVCIYHKESLSVREVKLSNLSPNLNL